MQNQKTGIATQTPKVDSHVGHSGERLGFSSTLRSMDTENAPQGDSNHLNSTVVSDKQDETTAGTSCSCATTTTHGLTEANLTLHNAHPYVEDSSARIARLQEAARQLGFNLSCEQLQLAKWEESVPQQDHPGFDCGIDEENIGITTDSREDKGDRKGNEMEK